MKTINKLFAALLVLPLAVGLSSCSEKEAEYTSAEQLTNAQVYFSNEMASTIDASKSEKSVSVPVYRVNTNGSINVPITSECSSDAYKIPSSVNFEDGESVAYIDITYNPDNVEYGDYADITLEIGEEGYTTPYGDASYTGKIGIPEPWTDWTLFKDGTCTWYYDAWLGGGDPGLEIYLRSNTVSKNKMQFMITGAYASAFGTSGSTIIFDYDTETGYVTCSPQYTGYTSSSYGETNVIGYYEYWTGVRGKGKDEVNEVYGSFDEEQGIISIPLVYYVSAGYFGAGYEYIYIDGYNRTDASISVAYAGKFVDTTDSVSVVANVTLGADVEYANVAVVPEDDLNQEVFNTILAGTYSPMVQTTESGEVRIPMGDFGTGNYYIVAVSYIGSDAQNYETAKFKYVTGAAETWTDLYVGTYTYNVFFTDDEGNPFADEGLVLSRSDQSETSFKISNWGMGVDFTFSYDGTNVVVDEQPTGYTDSSVGEILVSDITVYTGSTSYGQSYYDSSTGTFYFCVVYYLASDPNKIVGYNYETFTITGNAAKARLNEMQAKARKANKKSVKAVKKNAVKDLDLLRINKDFTPMFNINK